MTLLLDQNLSHRVKSPLSVLFEAIVHVQELGFDEAPDSAIWNFARERDWVILTKDGDFADMALLNGAPPKVIRLRVGNGPWRSITDVVLRNRNGVEDFLADPESSLLLLWP